MGRERNLEHLEHIEWNGRTFSRSDSENRTEAPIDTQRIGLMTEREMRYWTNAFAVTIYHLRDALQETESRDPAVVRAYLKARSEAAAES